MVDSHSTTIDSKQSINMCDTKNDLINENVKDNKRRLTLEECLQLRDKLLEIKQIERQERLVFERLDHINGEKEHLQNLLDILHAMDANDRMRNSRQRQRRLQKTHSKSRLN
jgi:hypothetical protein